MSCQFQDAISQVIPFQHPSNYVYRHLQRGSRGKHLINYHRGGKGHEHYFIGNVLMSVFGWWIEFHAN